MRCKIKENSSQQDSSNEIENIDQKREWILSKLCELNPRRTTGLKELAEYIASKPLSKTIEKMIAELELYED
jgi:hypothetical protein